MATSWISLMSSALYSKAFREIRYVPAGSWCVVVSESDVIQVDTSGENLYEVEAAIVNIGNVVYDSAKFLLPMDRPEGPLGISSAVLDQALKMYRVTTGGPKGKKDFPVQLTRTIRKSKSPMPNDPTEEHLGISLKPEKFNWADEMEEVENTRDEALLKNLPHTSSIKVDEGLSFNSMPRCAAVQPDEDKAILVPSPRRAMEVLDLDVVFGGEATSLEDDNGELTALPVSTNSASTTVAGRGADTSNPTFVNLRQYIPNDIFEEANALYNNLPPHYREDPRKEWAWSFSVRRVEWQYMCKASQELRGQKACEHPQALKVEDDENEGNEAPFHHLNFLGQRVLTKSATSPELSLWLVICSSRIRPFPPLTRRGVIASQATKLIDPIQYFGPVDILNFSGTELRNAATGFVEKVYHPYGTWMFDGYEEDEIPPRTIDENSVYWDNRNLEFEQMQKPYFMDPESVGDIVVNDYKTSHPPARRTCKGALPQPTPSKLRIVENADSEMEVISSHLPAVSHGAQHIEAPAPDTPRVNLGILESQAAEDIEAENSDFYEESSGLERTGSEDEENVEAPTTIENPFYQEQGLSGHPQKSIEEDLAGAAPIHINAHKEAQENIYSWQPTPEPRPDPTDSSPSLTASLTAEILSANEATLFFSPTEYNPTDAYDLTDADSTSSSPSSLRTPSAPQTPLLPTEPPALDYPDLFRACDTLEIPYADVSEIPAKARASDGVLYGALAVAVGGMARGFAGWVSERFL